MMCNHLYPSTQKTTSKTNPLHIYTEFNSFPFSFSLPIAMDVNQTNFTNPTLNLDMLMEADQILHSHDHQIPSNSSLWPPLDPTQIPISTSSFVGHQKLGNEIEDRQEDEADDEDQELGATKELMYRIAAMQPVDIDPATIRKPKRRNVRISHDPQSVAARLRREKISEKMRILQRLVPGGTKMDTASMLDEAIRYVKFLKRQIRLLESSNSSASPCMGQWQAPTAYHNPTNNTKGYGSLMSSTSLEPAPPGYTSHGGNGSVDPALCFNHEVTN